MLDTTKIFLQTNRLILREIIPEDETAFFELDSDPEVHKYLGNNPVTSIEQIRAAIQFIRQQYVDNGIWRWAVIEKSTNNFIGWAGLKLITEQINNHINYYDLGYRFIKKYWGLGYATEAAKASLEYGFDQLNLNEMYAMADVENSASNNVLKKIGFSFIETFDYERIKHNWYKIKKENWENKF